MVDILPEKAVIATLEDVTTTVFEQVMINIPVTYYTQCGAMFRGPEQTNTEMNKHLFVKDVQAGRVYIIKSEQHEH